MVLCFTLAAIRVRYVEATLSCHEGLFFLGSSLIN